MREELRALKSLAGPFPSFEADLMPGEPRDLFSAWLRDAIEAGIKEPHAMVLSTIDENGVPDARVLILKNLDRRGWH
ncbi:MAG: pyridoxamine 5'-phosphate oxidase family protein, partial [Rhizobium sp.]